MDSVRVQGVQRHRYLFAKLSSETSSVLSDYCPTTVVLVRLIHSPRLILWTGFVLKACNDIDICLLSFRPKLLAFCQIIVIPFSASYRYSGNLKRRVVG